MNLEGTLCRVLDKLDAQDVRSSEFREELLERLGEIESRLAVLETKEAGGRDGLKTVAWGVTTLLSILAVIVAYVK